MLLLVICLAGCKDLKKGEVVIENYKYVAHQVSKHCWEVNAEGTIKNIGKYDVKNVVVTGYCRSCQLKVIEGVWFTNDIPKAPDEKAIISYLTPGAEAPFSFNSIAVILTKDKPSDSELPEKMEVVIASFDTVQ